MANTDIQPVLVGVDAVRQRWLEFAGLYGLAAKEYCDIKAEGLARPTYSLRAAINWAFVQWHATQDAVSIRSQVGVVVSRGIEIAKQHDFRAGRAMRELHDNFLLQAAVLSGDDRLMDEAASIALTGNADDSRYQYSECWSGLLVARIKDDREKELAQWELMKRFKADRTFLWPSEKFMAQFVERNYHAFEKTLKTSCERHWRIAECDGAFAANETGTPNLDLGKKHQHFFWPYVEAVFAALAMRDGATIKYDSFWFPLKLITPRR